MQGHFYCAGSNGTKMVMKEFEANVPYTHYDLILLSEGWILELTPG